MYSTSTEGLREWGKKISRGAMITGALIAALGIVVALWPGATITVVGIAFGLAITAGGLCLIYMAIKARAIPVFSTLGLVFGSLITLVGVSTLIAPAAFATLIMIVAGVIVICQGIAALTVGKAMVPTGLVWVWLHGILSIILGILFLIAPLTSLYSMTTVIGILIAITGTTITLGSFRLGLSLR